LDTDPTASPLRADAECSALAPGSADTQIRGKAETRGAQGGEVTERLLTYKATAGALGVPYFKVQRAARAKLFPTYRLFNGRRLLKLSEVVAVIDSTREGGER
jgi:hypothetical protein